ATMASSSTSSTFNPTRGETCSVNVPSFDRKTPVEAMPPAQGGSEMLALYGSARMICRTRATRIGEQMHNKRYALRCALATLASLCSIATVESAEVAAQKIAIHAGRLIDVTRGTVLRDQLILVEGERITSVGAWNANAANGAQLIDLSAY